MGILLIKNKGNRKKREKKVSGPRISEGRRILGHDIRLMGRKAFFKKNCCTFAVG
jgi:hypothetical protein